MWSPFKKVPDPEFPPDFVFPKRRWAVNEKCSLIFLGGAASGVLEGFVVHRAFLYWLHAIVFLCLFHSFRLARNDAIKCWRAELKLQARWSNHPRGRE